MTTIRRSSRLSTADKASTQLKSEPKIWRRRHSKACVDSEEEAESENNENCNFTNSSCEPRPRSTINRKTYQEMSTADPKTPSSSQRIQRKSKTKKERKESAKHTLSSCEDKSDSDEKQVSPPKQSRKSSVPSHFISPSRLLDRLSIDDKSNFEDSEEEIPNVSEATQNKIKHIKRNKYQNARRVLNSAETNFLPGREKELAELQNFLVDHLNNDKSGSLYVSGQPGTGKTACLSKLLRSADLSNKFTKVYINCTSISTIGSIYKKICTEMKLKVQGRTERDYLEAIRIYLCAGQNKRKMILMVLDEIDQLCGQKQSVLYTIFEWPALPCSRLLLVGIANSLDLTDRMLMRLNVKCDLKPRLMHFAPYNKEQIVNIFKSRLEEAGVQDVFPPVTIQLLAAKVSAVSGDVRRALDIGRRVVEIAEQQKQSASTKCSKLNFSDLGLENDEPEELKPVQVTQVASVLSKVYGASQRLQEDMEESFPLQQKIMLCCLMLMLRKEKNKDITMGRLHDVYKRVCSKRNIQAVDQAEFTSLVELVETRGILRVIRKKEPRLGKVQLQWDEEEVNAALCDKQLIASILDDTACLGR